MAAKKEVSKQTATIIIVIVVVVVLVGGFLVFFKKGKVQPVAGKPQEFMSTEMKQKLQDMGVGKGVLSGQEPGKAPQ